MSSNLGSAARDGALAKLAQEAARFASPDLPVPTAPARPAATTPTIRAVPSPGSHRKPAGYVPVAVAPERGNTRPVVPVDGRIHMRIAPAMVDAVDQIVREWRSADPAGMRDLERATLVRIGIAMVLADIETNADGGAVGEAVRAALDPAIRHTDVPMPDLNRWLRATPAGSGGGLSADPHAGAGRD